MVWRRRKKEEDEEDFWDWDPFKEFDEIFRKMMRDIENAFRFGEMKESRPIIRGFSIRIGPDGRPEIREFGTKPLIKEMGVEERKPLVDVIETDNEIQVIAEMPGVKKEDIELKATERSLEIKAEGETRKYHEVVSLPADVDPDSAKARYNNGVLEVILQKKAGSGKKIKIE
ncbi:MAG: Hsp20/alpha crystallin family protein [Archaeoglobi archaeon]|jgi:HSP20 family protein|nr:Hsp20/alpha crystallin family protein [Archaeoglobales archaeon]TDA26961.1 MAG: Hsp20/alpha crystallin family protein [Archaeoglobi archaeon]TDA27770.1 MAG: Hsp20/alpha crystallin family protein [Archaeoglobi archaeon]